MEHVVHAKMKQSIFLNKDSLKQRLKDEITLCAKSTPITPHHMPYSHYSAHSDSYAAITELLVFFPDVVKKYGKTAWKFERLHFPFGAGPVDIAGLAGWLVGYAKDTNVDEALDALDRHLQTGLMHGYLAMAVLGIKVTEAFIINESLTLLPFEQLPRTYVTAELAPTFMNDQFLHKYRLWPSFSELYYTSPETVIVKRFTFQSNIVEPRKWEDVDMDFSGHYALCDLTVLVGRFSPQKVMTWGDVDEDTPCKDRAGSSQGDTKYDIVASRSENISTEQLHELKELYVKYTSMPEIDQRAISIAMQRISLSRRRKTLEDRAIELGVAIEVLLLNDNPESGLKKKVKKRARTLLKGHKGLSSSKIQDLFYAMYECRSHAVHRGSLDDFEGSKGVTVKQLLDDVDPLCVEIAKRVINRGMLIDWPCEETKKPV